MSHTINRVFLYGIDAGTWEFIIPHIEELPNFKKLIQKSIWGNLESTIPPVTPAAWTTMFSGVMPQKHGIFGFTQNEDPLSIEPPIMSKQYIGYPLIWDILSQANKYIVAVYIPFAYPPNKVKGLFISGMRTPSIKSNFVYPSQRKEEILDFNVEPDIPHEELLNDLNDMRNRYLKNLKNSIELIKYLLDFEPWNLFIYVLEEIDRIQHVFWKFIDPTHPLYDESLSYEYSGTILEFYKIADSFLGYLLKNLTNDAALIIASDHGMGSNHRRIVLNNWLYKNGYISLSGELSSTEFSKVNKIGKKIIRKYPKLGKLLSKTYAKTFGKRIFTIKRWNIDWKNTTAYSIHPFLIQINKTACKYGTLSQSEIKYYADELIIRLEKEKLFGEVGYYSTDWDKCVPDIFVKPKNPTDFIIPFSNKSSDLVEAPVNGGEHRMNGIYSLYSPEIKEVTRIDTHIVNITPTIIDLLSFKQQSYFDGISIFHLIQR